MNTCDEPSVRGPHILVPGGESCRRQCHECLSSSLPGASSSLASPRVPAASRDMMVKVPS